MLKKTLSTLAVTAFCSVPFSALAQHGDYHDNPHPYVKHADWKKGYHMDQGNWNNAPRVDYNHYHLHAPARGCEWREVDGNFVEAAIATGVVASVIAATR